MNGIWVRSETGGTLMLATNFNVISRKEGDGKPWALGIDDPIQPGMFTVVAEYETEEAAIRQLDDIQEWMEREGTATVDMEFGYDCEQVIQHIETAKTYDLRERKVKEGDQ